jgi:glyoxylase-like metal-dependent hydrolase (beta-lactamase superfamily II)
MKTDVRLLTAGSCRHAGKMALRTASWASVTFPASVIVIRHPREGMILFDTGYSTRFFEVTQSLPEKLYALVTPVALAQGESAAERLRAQGIDPGEVRWVVLSHFHADHIGGARDFPAARFLFTGESWAAVKNLGRFGATRAGFLRGLLPEDFESRGVTVEDFAPEVDLGWKGLSRGWDLFGDGSMMGVALPGHARGQMGVLVQDTSARRLLFCADAVWQSESVEGDILPHPLVRWALANSDWQAYVRTVRALHELRQRSPEIEIVPCHCGKSHQRLFGGGSCP